MASQLVRPPRHAGRWYPSDAGALAHDVDEYLGLVPQVSGSIAQVMAIVAPHAGLMFSGPVAAHAYRALAGRRFDVAILVGPSHYAAFDGVALYPRGAFTSPLGELPVDEVTGRALAAATPSIREEVDPHLGEHSLEMQLPFLNRVLPGIPIVPLLMGSQTPETNAALAGALAAVLADRRALLVASSDLSHYHDARRAAVLDGAVMERVDQFDADGLQALLDHRPEHACGGGPMVAVMRAARDLGAPEARVLKYADSGDVTGDKRAVVGYMAALFGSAA